MVGGGQLTLATRKISGFRTSSFGIDLAGGPPKFAIALLYSVPRTFDPVRLRFGCRQQRHPLWCTCFSAIGSALDEILGQTEYSFDLSKTNEAKRVLSLGFDTAGAEKERERTRHRSKMFDWETSSIRLKEIYDEL